MIDLNNIRSLSDFQRNTRQHIRRLEQSGKPEILTVNGEAAVVVQSAAGYQQLLDALDRADSVGILKQRLGGRRKGKQDIPADLVLAEIRAKLGLTEQP